MNTRAQVFEHHRVLFVDDELSLLNSMRRSLLNETFSQEYHSTAEEALQALTTQRFTVVVSDLKMPGLSGLEFLTVVKREFPKIIRIIATGVTDLSEVLTAMHSGETHRYISKPINVDEELLPTLYQSFEYYDMQRTQERLTKELIQLNTYLQHQQEEVAFFKDLSEKSNCRKEDILKRVNTIFPRLTQLLDQILPLVGPNSPEPMIALAEFTKKNKSQIERLKTDLGSALITLEFQPGEPI